MNLRWDLLLSDEAKLPRFLHFEEISDARFRYGIDELNQFCLYFFYPDSGSEKEIETLTRANLSLEDKSVEGKPALVLSLLNPDASNLFSDLIVSIVFQTRDKASKDLKAAFISVCNEWFDLFEPLNAQLSYTDALGIFAELSFLKFLLQRSKIPFNEVLESWKGPYGKSHDFVFARISFEVKGVSERKNKVSISSEYQLDFEPESNLVLCVIHFSDSADSTTTLSNLVAEITTILRGHIGTKLSIFWATLSKAGVSPDGISAYDHYRFVIGQTLFYLCSDNSFPAIRRSQIPSSLLEVKYEIKLDDLKAYLIEDIIPLL